MPNLRGKTWTTTTPANVEDAQYWEDHLISNEDAAKIGTVILPAGGTAGQVLTKQSGSPNDADWDDPASSGHTIEDEDGIVMPYQSTLQFVSAEVTNDSTNSRTVVDCKGAKGDAATVDAGTVTTLPAGSSATVVNSGTTSDAVFDFGIPRGADGTDGTDGEDGFSPAVTITSIPGGHRVNITDAEHPQGQNFNVMDGAGTGDMQASAYDPNNDVYNAGGIPAYLADEIVANPTGTPTDDLTSIQIGSTVYRLQGGGGTTIVQIPSVVGDSFTYNGTAQGPTITGLDSTHCTVTGATATNAGSYTLTIALNDPSSMVWSDLTTADKTYSYTIAKATQILTASQNSVSLTTQQPSDTVTISGQQGSLNVSSSDTGVATVSESSGVVTITAVGNGSATISVYAEETANYTQSTTVSISVASALVPNGQTVTPTDDIQTWLNCANIWDKTYTTIGEVLADSTTLLTLISSNNAADYMKRSTTWASAVTANSTAMSYIGANDYCADTLLADNTWLTAICNSAYFESVLNVKVPTMTSNTTPSGVASADSEAVIDTTRYAYLVFDNDSSTRWISDTRYSSGANFSGWIKYDYTDDRKNAVKKILVKNGNNAPINGLTLQGSNDDSTYTTITTITGLNIGNGGEYFADIENTTKYRYYKLLIEGQTTAVGKAPQLFTFQMYGR